jgi:prepilin-type N-terminal cleavage/methylation domain-containing protein
VSKNVKISGWLFKKKKNMVKCMVGGSMKKSGFTLIELLAVIVILAIIALISTPTIIGLIEQARKESFKNSAYGIIKAGELFRSQGLLDGTAEEVTFIYDGGVETSIPIGEKLEYNGLKPNSGSVLINEKGKVALAIHNGKYCAKKGYNDSEVIVSDRSEQDCGKDFINGEVVLFNPVEGISCTEVAGNCMKWYAFNDNGVASDTINLILDHNTPTTVAWNLSGSNIDGPNEVFTKLQTDTSSWEGVPIRTDSYSVNNGTANYTINYNGYRARLITADEIAEITGASSIDTIKWSSSKTIGTTIDTQSSWFYFDGGRNIGKTTYSNIDGWQKQFASSLGASNYAWLFDYTKNCTNYGCNISDSSNYGYWTSTAVSGSDIIVWYVYSNGYLGNNLVDNIDTHGVRPVITISKSILK